MTRPFTLAVLKAIRNKHDELGIAELGNIEKSHLETTVYELNNQKRDSLPLLARLILVGVLLDSNVNVNDFS